MSRYQRRAERRQLQKEERETRSRAAPRLAPAAERPPAIDEETLLGALYEAYAKGAEDTREKALGYVEDRRDERRMLATRAIPGAAEADRQAEEHDDVLGDLRGLLEEAEAEDEGAEEEAITAIWKTFFPGLKKVQP